jgi:hypothetical protein
MEEGEYSEYEALDSCPVGEHINLHLELLLVLQSSLSKSNIAYNPQICLANPFAYGSKYELTSDRVT